MDPTDGYTSTVEPDGTIVEEYRLNGELHRDDGPARITNDAHGALIEEFYRNGKLHRENGPARIEQQPDGSHYGEYWYRNGEQHCSDGPAVIEREADGSLAEEYWLNGQLHRDDGPAEIEYGPDGFIGYQSYWRDGTRLKDAIQHDTEPPDGHSKTEYDGTIIEECHQNGQLHRDDGPAHIVENLKNNCREESYYRNGKLHRDDGPAVIEFHNNRPIRAYCFRDGIRHPEDEPQLAIIQFHLPDQPKQAPGEDRPPDGYSRKTNSDGAIIQEYRQNGQLHREDGPARILTHPHEGVTEEYYRNGRCHREDGPACLQRLANGIVVTERWGRNGELHRENGPAWIDRHENGIVLSERWFHEPEGLHRTNAPAWIERDDDGTVTAEYWYHHRLLDRTDGPAWVARNPDGSASDRYFLNGQLHRDDGPASIERYAPGSAIHQFITENEPDGAPNLIYHPDGSIEERTHWSHGTQLEHAPQPTPEASEKQHDRFIGQIRELEQKYKDPSTSDQDKERIESYLNRTQEHAENLRKSAAPEKEPEGPLTAIEKIVADARRQTPQQDELQKRQELERQRQKDRDRGR
jgi:antitoxin component YwqK of YwqJK toxin-antitoxin module